MYVEFVWLSPSLIHYVEKAVLMQLWNLFVEFQYQDCLKEDNPQEGNKYFYDKDGKNDHHISDLVEVSLLVAVISYD